MKRRYLGRVLYFLVHDQQARKEDYIESVQPLYNDHMLSYSVTFRDSLMCL